MSITSQEGSVATLSDTEIIRSSIMNLQKSEKHDKNRQPKDAGCRKKDNTEMGSLRVNFATDSIRSDPSNRSAKFRKMLRLRMPDKPIRRVFPKSFTTGRMVNPRNDRTVETEPSPYIYPKDYEEMTIRLKTKTDNEQLRMKELRYKYNRKHNCQTRQAADLLNRIKIADPPMTDLLTIKDVNPEFYSVVQGRPIPDRMTIREYINTVREVLRTKIITGYREDDIMLLNENLESEEKKLAKIRKKYQNYANAFEEFIYNDHVESMKQLKEAEEEAAKAAELYKEHKKVSKEYGLLRSQLYNTEEKWRNCKMYQTFLYLISPVSWRKQHDPRYTENEVVVLHNVSDIFGKYRLTNTEGDISFEDLIHQFMEEYRPGEVPQLYYNHPDELMEVFRFMELQNLNAMLHSEELAVQLMNVKDGMRKAEQLFAEEINNMQEIIDKLEGDIIFEENRAKYLEKFAMFLISEEFRKATIDENVLNLHVFVEDVYETRIAPNDANLNVSEMMKAVEKRYLEELLVLDKTPPNLVADIELKYYANERKILKQAKDAARKLAELEITFQKLANAFSPAHQKSGRELKWRSPPYNPPEPPATPPHQLTPEEMDYLNYFTDYCKHTDKIEDYGIKIDKTSQKVRSTSKVSKDINRSVRTQN